MTGRRAIFEIPTHTLQVNGLAYIIYLYHGRVLMFNHKSSSIISPVINFKL